MSIVLSTEEMTDLLVQVFMRHGMTAGNARTVAEVVVAAERDGSRSHGLLRLPGYIATLKSGWVDGAAIPSVTDYGPGLVMTDSCNGFAQVALAASRNLLIEKARSQGVAALMIRNSHHFAALWTDVEPFAEQGFVALAAVNARSRVVVWGGKKKSLGTNPLAFACPRPGEPPLVWDQASSVMAQGEVLVAAAENRQLPSGIGLDAEGRPTTDPKAVLEGGALMPFGGHKGSSIAFMVEILAAGLTGGRFGFEDRSAAYPGAQTSNAGEFILLVDPPRLPGQDFLSRIGSLFESLAASGVSRLPSERRYERRRRSLTEGIKVSAADYEKIQGFLGAGT